jgi:hypothetical protein
MKLASIFNIVADAQDVLDLFEGVTNVDQLRGRLRRLNQIEADDLLTCLEGLRISVAAALSDTLEMNPDLEEPSDLGDASDHFKESSTLDSEPSSFNDLMETLSAAADAPSSIPEENQNPEPPAPAEK